MTIKAVIFDLGGVVMDSPMEVFSRFEVQHGLPHNFLNHLIVKSGPGGAWARLERGELTIPEFCRAFDAEIAAAGGNISSAQLMAAVAATGNIRPAMLEAIRKIRAHGLKTAALTNNWAVEDDRSRYMTDFKNEFDVFIESSKTGLAKPDPRIYQLVCDKLGLRPDAAVFLDDIGRNLKTARTLGMATIKVADPDQALAELEELLGFPLK